MRNNGEIAEIDDAVMARQITPGLESSKAPVAARLSPVPAKAGTQGLLS
jgi:hypothetical protein